MMPLPFGVSAKTAHPLPGLEAADLRAFATSEVAPEQALSKRAAQLSFSVTGDIGAVGDVDANNLAQVGWGVVFPRDVDPRPLKDALKPLLDLRRRQSGDNLFKIFEASAGVHPAESAGTWLERHGVSFNVVDPDMGVPFYLLLVGNPERIPFEFQYTLDIFWAVGRLDFPTLDEYRRYAESVVEYERVFTLPHSRHISMFATCHTFDSATQMFMKQVAEPLTKGTTKQLALGRRHNFAITAHLGRSATKGTLLDILRNRGQPRLDSPAILFTGTHGVGFGAHDDRLVEMQGALICQDWPAYGKIKEEHWFAAVDVPNDARVHGLIHLFFACFSAGTPEFDNFRRAAPMPVRIAPRPITARLPQVLLAHKNGGALCALGHIDKAWATSFQSNGRNAQTQGFRDVVGRLLQGNRVGLATDQFNVRWAALATELDRLRAVDSITDEEGLANIWIARDDARNYVILGDPAVRLRVENMPNS